MLLAGLLASGCAQGFAHPEEDALGLRIGSAGRVADEDPDGGMADAPSESAEAEPSTDPCSMGEVQECICEDTGTAGQASCLADPASPAGGFFDTVCRSCAPPEPEEDQEETQEQVGTEQAPDACTDGELNDGETDVDCGGPRCDVCAEGKACLVRADCAAGECIEGICTMPMDTGTPPMAGTGSGCTSNPGICSGLLACCRADGTCGAGLAVLCL